MFSPELIAGRPFTLVDRKCGSALLYDTKPTWIVFYEAIAGIRHAYYQAYKTVAALPKGREPWSVDNKRFTEHGYPTLTEAMTAIEEKGDLHQ